MNKEFFADKKIVILGLARQGVALARFFASCGAKIVVSDLGTASQLKSDMDSISSLKVDYVLGEHPLSLLDGCDLLALSGGVPPQIPIVKEAVKRGIALTNDSLLTLQVARAQGLGPIVAITGSSGKTTTTSLVGQMLGRQNQPIHVGGNIGVPLIDRLHTVQSGEPIVLELSSFQLELFDPETAGSPLAGIGPDVAAILNITPNHLDRHSDMAAYTSAKLNLLRYLPSTAQIVLGADDPVTSALMSERPSNSEAGPPAEWQVGTLLQEQKQALASRNAAAVEFSQYHKVTKGAMLDREQLLLNDQLICFRDELKLRGDHNVSNVLAAAAISKAAGASLGAIREVATNFEGVAHRLEVVAQRDGAIWVNDSIATSPERALAGLRSFDTHQHSLILLAGGKDKNLPWQTLADEVISNVNYLIGFGAYGPDFVRMVQERSDFAQGSVPTSATAKHLDQAIELAARVVESERAANPDNEVVVLLSPGGTSYDAYKDFEERGEHFRKLVKALEN